jgi:hypothetical protein
MYGHSNEVSFSCPPFTPGPQAGTAALRTNFAPSQGSSYCIRHPSSSLLSPGQPKAFCTSILFIRARFIIHHPFPVLFVRVEIPIAFERARRGLRFEK